MIYVKINEILYPATIAGKMSDKDWDGRPTKTIKLEMTYAEAINIFVDGLVWSIVSTSEIPLFDEAGAPLVDEEGNQFFEVQEDEFDNSEYVLAGDITDHRDGMLSVKMGALNDLELTLELVYGGM